MKSKNMESEKNIVGLMAGANLIGVSKSSGWLRESSTSNGR